MTNTSSRGVSKSCKKNILCSYTYIINMMGDRLAWLFASTLKLIFPFMSWILLAFSHFFLRGPWTTSIKLQADIRRGELNVLFNVALLKKFDVEKFHDSLSHSTKVKDAHITGSNIRIVFPYMPWKCINSFTLIRLCVVFGGLKSQFL